MDLDEWLIVVIACAALGVVAALFDLWRRRIGPGTARAWEPAAEAARTQAIADWAARKREQLLREQQEKEKPHGCD
jgi:hypothetical protein